MNGFVAFSIVDDSLKACSDIEGDNCPTPWDYCCETDKLPGAITLVKLVNEEGQLIEGDAKDRITAAGKKSPGDKKTETEKIMAELAKAFDKSAEMKSAGGKGPKYSELIKEGKLPVDPAKPEAAYKAEKKKAEAEKSGS